MRRFPVPWFNHLKNQLAGRDSRGFRTFVVIVIAASLAGSTVAGAAITIDGTADVAYVEQAPAITIADGLTLAGGSPYAGGRLEFSIADATSAETLDFKRAAAPDPAATAVSVVGTDVFLGNGVTAERIGTITSEKNGGAGRPLEVTFEGRITIGDFDDRTLQGWTPIETQVDLGTTAIAGHPTVDTSTYPAGSTGTDDLAPELAGELVVEPRTDFLGASLLLETGRQRLAERCGVFHGPAAYSPTFEAEAGDQFGLAWRAEAIGDSFAFLGYLVDESGTQTEVVDHVHDAITGSTEWTRARATIPADGTYRFVTIGGNHDRSCGRQVRGEILVDNVVLAPPTIDDLTVQRLARLVTYRNSSDDPAPIRTATVETVNTFGEWARASFDIVISAEDDALAIDAVPSVTFENTAADDTFTNIVGSLHATDPDGAPITFSMPGAETGAFEADGADYDQRVVSASATVLLDTTSGDYVVVPDDAAIEATTDSGTDDPIMMTATAGASTASTPLVIEVLVTGGATLTEVCLSPTWTEDASDVYDDVSARRTWHDAASWAHENSIVVGRIPGLLHADEFITRAEFVTMVHRMLCLPTPTATAGFGDLTAGAFYRTALDWAVGEGVIRGTSPTTFSPNDPLTRGHVAAIMHRLAGWPAVPGPSPYIDLRVGAYYEDGANWMGLSGLVDASRRYDPDAAMTRGHALLVLWRYTTLLD